MPQTFPWGRRGWGSGYVKNATDLKELINSGNHRGADRIVAMIFKWQVYAVIGYVLYRG